MARQFTKGSDLVRAQQRKFARDKKTVRDAFQDMVDDGLDDHRELTGGSVKTKELARRGHPFGRGPVPQKRGKGSFGKGQRGIRSKTRVRRTMRTLPINRQRGKLQDSLRMQKFRNYIDIFFAPGDGSLLVLLPLGTRYMVARGFQAEVERRHKARTKAFELAAVRGLVKP